MCDKCEGNGYVVDVIDTTVKMRSKETIEDYTWGNVACDCDLGECWKRRNDGVDKGFKRRANAFADKFARPNVPREFD